MSYKIENKIDTFMFNSGTKIYHTDKVLNKYRRRRTPGHRITWTQTLTMCGSDEHENNKRKRKYNFSRVGELQPRTDHRMTQELMKYQKYKFRMNNVMRRLISQIPGISIHKHTNNSTLYHRKLTNGF